MQIRLNNNLFFSIDPVTIIIGSYRGGIRKDLITLIMRTFIFLFCTTLFSLTPKHVCSQNDRIVINADMAVSVDAVFKIIKTQTNYSFIYHEDLFKKFPNVKLKKGTIRLNRLLNHCFSSVSDIDIIFTANNNILIKERNIQQYKISGTVTDQSGLPIPGTTVLIKGTSKGVASNIDGQYSISVQDPANVLVFSSLGFETKEVIVGNQKVINVTLKEDISQLDEVIIQHNYYETSKKRETGTISRITAETIEKQPVNNPLAAMQGHLPGVNISQNGGLPGGNFRVQIRGKNFLNGRGLFSTENSPLYVVDGVPYNVESLESGRVTAADNSRGGVSPLNTINPANIESIDVLKDADATAIYGSRGANGVVLITTKKGKEGKTQIKLNVSTTLSKVTRFVDLLNTQQYLEVAKEAIENDGYTLETLPPEDKLKNPDLYLWDQDRYTDWQEVLTGGTAYRQNAQLAFSGGSTLTQFLLSGAYSTQSTVFPGDSKYSNTGLNVNVNHQSKDNRFKLSFSGKYGADTNNLLGQDLTRESRVLQPNAPALYDDSGNLNWENRTWRNPLGLLETDYNVVTKNVIANTILSYRPMASLEFKTSLGYTDYRLDSYWSRPHTFLGPTDPTIGLDSSISSVAKNSGSRESWIIEPQINWKQHWGDLSFKLLVGATFQQNKEQQYVIQGIGFASNSQILNLRAADLVLIPVDNSSEYKYQSFFGRVNLNWGDTYIVNLTGRRDGSSRFGPGKQFGYFGAVGAAWVFSEEKVLEDIPILSFGKLRASYGITGSDNIGDYKFLDTYSGDDTGNYNGSGIIPSGLFNPNFAWGETRNLEAGLELGFFKDRIALSMAWYRSQSSNQLINIGLPTTTGFSGINGNFDAIVQNTGLEIDLNTVNINGDQFKWRSTFNLSFNRNKLVRFDNLESSTFANTLVLGESITVRKLFRLSGVDSETGIYQYEDYNNDGLINFNDRQWLEDLTPKYFGGFGNTLTYKDLQLDVFFQFTKQKAPSYLSSTITSFGQNLPTSILDRWQHPGDQKPVQRYYYVANSAISPALSEAGRHYSDSNAAIIDGSFIRLRNISLSYTLPKTLTKEVDLNLYLQGQNLFVITKYDGADPEIWFTALPPLRQITLGLNLTF